MPYHFVQSVLLPVSITITMAVIIDGPRAGEKSVLLFHFYICNIKKIIYPFNRLLYWPWNPSERVERIICCGRPRV